MAKHSNAKSGDIFEMKETSEMWPSPFESSLDANMQLNLHLFKATQKGADSVESRSSELLAKLEERNSILLSKLKEKDDHLKILVNINTDLGKELKRSEKMRLAQLENLALRNVELERQVCGLTRIR